MNDAEILKKFEDDLWKSSPHTVSSRTFYARMWLDFAGRPPEQWDRALVIRFLKRLDDEGYAKGTQHNVFWITKRVFDAAQVPWPMGKRGAPKVQASDVVKPALDIDELRVMIETAKHGKPSIISAGVTMKAPPTPAKPLRTSAQSPTKPSKMSNEE